jgi:hypothetical protein
MGEHKFGFTQAMDHFCDSSSFLVAREKFERMDASTVRTYNSLLILPKAI